MSQETKSLIRGAQQAIKLGNKPQARHFLQQVVQQDPENFAGWLLLASVTANPQTALAHIKRAEALNPSSQTVQKAKAWAEARVPAASPKKLEADEGKGAWWQRPYLRWGMAAVLLIVVVVGLSAALWNQDEPSRSNAAADAESAQVVAAAADSSMVAESGGAQVTMTSQPERTDMQSAVEGETAVSTPEAPAIQPKPISHQNSEPRPTWTMTPIPTPTPTPTNTPMPTFVAQQTGPVTRPFGVGPNERWVDVNLTTQTLVAYEGDTPALSTFISSGTWQFPTVTGQFRIYLTYTSQTMDGRRLGYDYYLENVPYVMYFYEDYALHGTFWHNNFGTPMSHGCVNMRTSEAEWLFNWSSIGTLVNVHY